MGRLGFGSALAALVIRTSVWRSFNKKKNPAVAHGRAAAGIRKIFTPVMINLFMRSACFRILLKT